MWEDPIVEEVRRAREEHALKFNYNIDDIIPVSYTHLDVYKRQDVNQIAQDMFFVFQYPDQLIQKGLKRSSEFNWDTSAKLLCTIINI